MDKTVRRCFYVAVALALLIVASHYPLEQLVITAITLFLMIGGFFIILKQKKAWEFVWPLFLISIALLLLPAFLHEIATDLRISWINVWESIGTRWIWTPVFAA